MNHNAKSIVIGIEGQQAYSPPSYVLLCHSYVLFMSSLRPFITEIMGKDLTAVEFPI